MTYPKVKIINKHLMAVQWRECGMREVMPNLFEAAKAYCIAHAKGLAVELPYTVDVLDSRLEDSHPQLFAWYHAFTSDNHPQRISFAGQADKLRELIEPIDFSRPFDRGLADSIREQFLAKPKAKEVDAEQIIEAELEG